MSIRTLGKQSLVYGFGTIIARLVTFLLLPLYTNVFTQEEYGIVALAYAFMGFIMIVYRYGMDTALMKFYVDSEGEDRHHYFTTIFSIQVLTSILFSGLLYLFAEPVSPFLLGTENRIFMVLISAIVFFDALWMLPMIVLRAEERPFSYILLSIFNVVLLMVLNIVLVIFLKQGVKGVLVGNLVASCGLFLMTIPIIFQRFKLLYLKRHFLKEVLRFGLPFFPAGIFTMIMELADRYMLEWFTDTATVGLYSAGYKLGMIGLLLVMAFNMGWMPYFLKRGKEPGAKKEFARITTIFLGGVGFLMILVSLWADALVQLQIGNYTFFGKEFWESTTIVPIILIGYYFFGTYVLQLPSVYLSKQTDWVPIFRGFGALTLIILSLLVIQRFNMIGVAWAKAAAFGVMSLSVWLKTKSKYRIPFYWLGILFPVFYLIIAINIPASLLVKAFLSLGYPLIWLIFILHKEDRDKLFHMFS
ncbi:lipopolysaccharide biosynthesis protein [Candidatus Neomarinimicrobiota bacterium]